MMTTDITMQFSRTLGALRLAAPRLGEHTASILASIGYTLAQIVCRTAPGDLARRAVVVWAGPTVPVTTNVLYPFGGPAGPV